MLSHKPVVTAIIDHYDSDQQLKAVYTIESPHQLDDTIELSVLERGQCLYREEFSVRSLVRNWILIHYSIFTGGINSVSIIDTLGVTRTSTVFTTQRYNSGAGVTTYGLIAGSSGSTEVNPIEWKLGTPIAHGATDGTLSYSATTFDNSEASGSSWGNVVRRTLHNFGSTPVTIREMGLVSLSATRNYLNARDVLDVFGSPIAVEVAQNQTAEIKYNIYTDNISGFTKNYHLMTTCLYSGGSTTITYINGGTSTLVWAGSNFDTLGPAGNHVYGIVVGSGSNPINSLDYCLQSRIGHGITDGLIYYYATEIDPPVLDGSINYFLLRRGFANNSGGDISVEEIGLYFKGSNTAVTSIMGLRFTTGGIAVANNESLTVKLKFMVNAN